MTEQKKFPGSTRINNVSFQTIQNNQKDLNLKFSTRLNRIEQDPDYIARLFDKAFLQVMFPGGVPNQFQKSEAKKVCLTREQLIQISKKMGFVMS